MTVGECWGQHRKSQRLYTDPARKEFSMVFQFEQIMLDQEEGKERWDLIPLNLPDLKKCFANGRQTL